jgi:hypothetical protein
MIIDELIDWVSGWHIQVVAAVLVETPSAGLTTM